MTRQFIRILFVAFVGIALPSGCGSQPQQANRDGSPSGPAPASHDPDDIPLTAEQIATLKQGVTDYADALAKIKAYRDTIRDGIAAGDPHKAHRPLDQLDAVLDHLTTVARDSNVPKSDWETVNTSAQQVRDLFNKVHAQIDAGEEPDYAAVSEEIEATLAKLAGVQPAK